MAESDQFKWRHYQGAASSENGLFIAKIEFSVRTRAESEEKTPRYAGMCRAITSAEAALRVSQGEKGIIRFKPPKTLM